MKLGQLQKLNTMFISNYPISQSKIKKALDYLVFSVLYKTGISIFGTINIVRYLLSSPFCKCQLINLKFSFTKDVKMLFKCTFYTPSIKVDNKHIEHLSIKVIFWGSKPIAIDRRLDTETETEIEIEIGGWICHPQMCVFGMIIILSYFWKNSKLR